MKDLLSNISKNRIVILVLLGIVLIAGIISVMGVFKKSNPLGIIASSKTIASGEDVCASFPKEWVAKTIGKTIVNTKTFTMNGTYNCQYYIDDTNAAYIKAEDLSIENQKKGQQELGRTVKTDSRIKMEHFIAMQENGLINIIYLVLTPHSFVGIDRTSVKVFDNEGEINFAAKVAEQIQSGPKLIVSSNSMSSTPTVAPTKSNVAPLPQEADVVRSFFNLITEHKVTDAVAMLTQTQTQNDSQKQAWAVMFNAFESVSVKNIEASMPEEWANNSHTYMVTLDVKMKPESANAVIPYFGYDNGENVRFVTLEKVGSSWKVNGIATGP